MYLLVKLLLFFSSFLFAQENFIENIKKLPQEKQIKILQKRIQLDMKQPGNMVSEEMVKYYYSQVADKNSAADFLFTEVSLSTNEAKVVNYFIVFGKNCLEFKCQNYLDKIMQNKFKSAVKEFSRYFIASLQMQDYEMYQGVLPKIKNIINLYSQIEGVDQDIPLKGAGVFGLHDLASLIAQRVLSKAPVDQNTQFLICINKVYTEHPDKAKECLKTLGTDTAKLVYFYLIKLEGKLDEKQMKDFIALSDYVKSEILKKFAINTRLFIIGHLNETQKSESIDMHFQKLDYENTFAFLMLVKKDKSFNKNKIEQLTEAYEKKFSNILFARVLRGEESSSKIASYFGEKSFYYQVTK